MTLPPGADRICINCGKAVARDRERLCNNCGLPFAPAVDPYEKLLSGSPFTIVRTYTASRQADANSAFQNDAAELAKHGYQPTTQSWAPGQWGCAAFLVALLLCVVLVGFLAFIYMLIVK